MATTPVTDEDHAETLRLARLARDRGDHQGLRSALRTFLAASPPEPYRGEALALLDSIATDRAATRLAAVCLLFFVAVAIYYLGLS